MVRKTKITILGKEYPTKKKAAATLGVSEQTMITWVGTGNVDACVLKHQRDNERHEQRIIERITSVTASKASKDPFGLRVPASTYTDSKTGMPATSYKWQETPEFLAKIRELVLAGLEEEQVRALIGIPSAALAKLKLFPDSQIVPIIAQSRAERDLKAMTIRQSMLDGSYVAPDGKALSQQTHAQMLKHYIEREDKLAGRGAFTVTHVVDDRYKRLETLDDAAFFDEMLSANNVQDADFTVAHPPESEQHQLEIPVSDNNNGDDDVA